MAEAKRHQFPVPEERLTLQVLLEAVRSEAAEVGADGAAKPTDEKLALARPAHGIVARRGEPEIVGRDGGRRLASVHAWRNVERNAGPVCRAEVRVQTDGGQPLPRRLRDERNRRAVRVDIEEPAVL